MTAVDQSPGAAGTETGDDVARSASVDFAGGRGGSNGSLREGGPGASDPVRPVDVDRLDSVDPVRPVDVDPLDSVDPVRPVDVDPLDSVGPVGPVDVDPVDQAELVTQIRQLAGCDPADVQRVIGEVLAALDRVSGGRLREQAESDIRSVSDEVEGGRTADPG